MATWIIWAVFGTILIIGELILPGTFFLFAFGIGALIASVVSAITNNAVIQVIAFIGGGFCVVWITRHLMNKKDEQLPHEKAGVDRFIGMTGVVLDSGDITHLPRIRVEGEEWLAKSEKEDETYEVGTKVKIIKISGNKLIVKRIIKD